MKGSRLPADLHAVEICAGAGGQALGLELAGFSHALAVELDFDAAVTLSVNRPGWDVRDGDVTDPGVLNPVHYEGVDLLAGGVPCPPFSIAGKQLGAADERDLFAWAVELAGKIRPRALLLENVRGLSAPRFAAYRQHIAGRLAELGYWSQWQLLYAADYGVPQLRPRFVLVAMSPEDARWFRWPEPVPLTSTVGNTLISLMASRGWGGALAWARQASDIAPTIVGGSKKHGGADLGPTRARKAWAALGVDGRGIADAPPGMYDPQDHVPRLTCEMVQLLQGWHAHRDYAWRIEGRKTSRYRQIGNAFPPPVARAVGQAIAAALRHDGEPSAPTPGTELVHDSVFMALRAMANSDLPGYYAVPAVIASLSGEPELQVLAALRNLERDFVIETRDTPGGTAYRLGDFRGYTG